MLRTSWGASFPKTFNPNWTTQDSSLSWNSREYVYGPGRTRPRTWERDCNRDKMRRGQLLDQEQDVDSKIKPKPDVPTDELGQTVSVKGIYLHFESNTKQHRTDQYDRVDGTRIVLRRGDKFLMTLQLDRKYDKRIHDMRIGLSFGENPDSTKGTLAEMHVDESTKDITYPPTKWGAQLLSQENKYTTVKISIPANCIVGEWNLYVKTFSKGTDSYGREQRRVFKYEHPVDVTVLFNPWCPHDDVYMESSDQLNEYVLNETGCVYRGTPGDIGAKEWSYGQFKESSFEASLYILRESCKDMEPTVMSDPVFVSRNLARIINAPDDNGVLVGNWTGTYSDGTHPGAWAGSGKILAHYMRSQTAVKYAQCWVFSGVTTTVFRALGLPCRSVTCFTCARDSTFGKYHNMTGQNDERSNRSTWTFHVWNEVWMRRSDLGSPGFDGWQAVDATPQELSGGVCISGPCPVVAVKNGVISGNKYDTGFVFSEVNSDVVTWDDVLSRGMQTTVKQNTRQVGKLISTKIPDGLPYRDQHYDHSIPPARLSEMKRLDLTNKYKYPGGSVEERRAIKRAMESVSNQATFDIDSRVEQQVLDLQMNYRHNVLIGSDLELEVVIRNHGDLNRTVQRLEVRVYPQTYIGYVGEPFYQKHLHNFRVPRKTESTCPMTLRCSDYWDHLFELYVLKIEAIAFLQPIPYTDPERPILGEVVTRFRRPDIDVRSPSHGQIGKPVIFELSFRNPLTIPLTHCGVSAETTSGFYDIGDIKQRYIPANGSFKTTVQGVPMKTGRHTVTFTFDSIELQDVTGSGSVVIATDGPRMKAMNTSS